jgi:hypothetical protein
MTTKTRYFVIVSLLVLGVGFGTGLVAYYVGFPAGAFASRGGPLELNYVPRDASVIAFANVNEIMNSELRHKLRRAIPMQENGQQELENQTGINLETDIDTVVACMSSDATASDHQGAGIVLARGRFDETKIEALMREHGAHVETYDGKRLIVADPNDIANADKDTLGADDVNKPRAHTPNLSLSFMEPGLAAIGSTRLIKSAIDLHKAGNNPQAGLESVTGNEELMNLVRSLDNSNAWAVGRFDALRAHARLPENVLGQIPAISWFAVSAHINGGLRGTLRAEARDDDAAKSLREVVTGFLALAKLGAGAKPELQAMMQSLELGGTGKTVSLSFAVPAELFDVIGAAAAQKKPAIQ